MLGTIRAPQKLLPHLLRGNLPYPRLGTPRPIEDLSSTFLTAATQSTPAKGE